MRINLFTLIVVALISCSEPDRTSAQIVDNKNVLENTTLENGNLENPQKSDSVFQDVDSVDEGENENWLTPEFLTADFNNDSIADTAYAVVISGKKGIRIKHGGRNEEFIIGAGNHFGNGGDDFYWLDYWNLVHDTTTYQTTFKDDGDVLGFEEVDLESTAIFIGNEEMGGAIIAWLNSKYIWVHQAD